MTKDSINKSVASLWPIAIYLGAVLTIDISVFSSFSSSLRLSPLIRECVQFLFFTILISQAGIFCVLGGLLCRAWTKGFLIASVLSTFFCAATYASLLLQEDLSTETWEMLLTMLLIVPGLLFAGSVPLLVFRVIFGCSLTRETPVPNFPSKIRLEGILILTAVTAAMVMLVMGPMRTVGDQSNQRLDFTLVILQYFAMAAIASSVGVLPVTIVYFAGRTVTSRVMRLMFFGGLSLGGMTTLNLVFPGVNAWSIGGCNRYIVTGLFSMISATVFSLGLIAMRGSGLRLIYHPKASSVPAKQSDTTVDPFLEPTASKRTTDPIRLQSRYAAIVIVLLSWLAIMAVQSNQWRKNSQAKKLEKRQSEFSAAGGALTLSNGKITAAKLPPDSTIDTLRDLEGQGTITRLSLAHVQITNDIIGGLGRFPNLKSLDLSYTNFSDEGLQKLPSGLTTLKLAGTKVTSDGISKWQPMDRIAYLDLSELQLSDENVIGIFSRPIRFHLGISLRGNPITDRALPSLANYSMIDVSDTQVDGSNLAKLTKVNELILDGTNVTDQTMVPFLQSYDGWLSLSLKRTDVTFETLAAIKSLHSLALGDGAIDDDALARRDLPVSKLTLNARQFTGRSFRQLQTHIQELSMRGSGMDDETVANLANLQVMRKLDLSDTAITDKGLREVAKLKASDIDLSNTKVTALGLGESAILGRTIRVAPNQFTPAELTNLRDKMTIIIESDIDKN